MKNKKKVRTKPTKTSPIVFGLPLYQEDRNIRKAGKHEAHCFSSTVKIKDHVSHLTKHGWQIDSISKRPGVWHEVAGSDGVAWVGTIPPVREKPGYGGQLTPSAYSNARDFGATLATRALDAGLYAVEVKTHGLTHEEVQGLYVGVQLGRYRYRKVRGIAGALPATNFVFSARIDPETEELANATNLARHLVNVPPNELNPETFSTVVKDLFKGHSSVTVEVLQGEKLVKERMGLLLAVGGGQTVTGPRLIHIKYRPKGGKNQPIAFVGKGITFDSGGLNIKDSASMRLMKKDMGGAASVVATAYWLVHAGVEVASDFYLALAENSVSASAFRPGDVITARSGLQVEIDNTDAEGRLVLADALDYAVTRTGKDKPSTVINLATLTGAMRVALGTKVAGMFATDEDLAADLLNAAQSTGEAAWRMPLVHEYVSHLKSTLADFANTGPNRFGGAISAAVFLHKFVGDTPWAHVDLYAWSEGGSGIEEPGGNGQFVQALSQYLLEQSRV